jgi:hypothetical protein
VSNEPTPVEPLLDSILEKLNDLVQHAGTHAYRDGVNGIPLGSKDAPPCLIQHAHEISLAVWAIVPADRHQGFIILPRDMPEGLRAQATTAVSVVKAGGEIPVDVLDQMAAFARDAAAGRKAGERR